MQLSEIRLVQHPLTWLMPYLVRVRSITAMYESTRAIRPLIPMKRVDIKWLPILISKIANYKILSDQNSIIELSNTL